MSNISRIGGGQPENSMSQIVQERAEWWQRSWFLNLAIGFIFTAVLCSLFGLLDSGKYPTACGIGFLVWFVAAVATEFLPFESKWSWKIGGGIPALLIILPLTVTPHCGWHNDQCKPVHQIHHAK